jgi:hypothetical protein
MGIQGLMKLLREECPGAIREQQVLIVYKYLLDVLLLLNIFLIYQYILVGELHRKKNCY